MPDNKKGLLKYVNSNKTSKENIGPILIKDGPLQNRDAEEARSFNHFFASVFNTNDRPWAVQSSELENHICWNSDTTFVDTENGSGQMYQLKVLKSIGPCGIHSRVLNKLVAVMTGPLSIVYQSTLGSLRRSPLTGSWLTLFQFTRRA